MIWERILFGDHRPLDRKWIVEFITVFTVDVVSVIVIAAETSTKVKLWMWRHWLGEVTCLLQSQRKTRVAQVLPSVLTTLIESILATASVLRLRKCAISEFTHEHGTLPSIAIILRSMYVVAREDKIYDSY